MNVPDEKNKKHNAMTTCPSYKDNDSICPSVCGQFCEGWNAAMKHIFDDGPDYEVYLRGGEDEDSND